MNENLGNNNSSDSSNLRTHGEKINFVDIEGSLKDFNEKEKNEENGENKDELSFDNIEEHLDEIKNNKDENEVQTNISEEKLNLSKKEQIDIFVFSSKITFVAILFVFILILFLLQAGIGKDLLARFFSPIYILLLIITNIFIYFSSSKIFFEKIIIAYVITGISILASIFFILPVIL